MKPLFLAFAVVLLANAADERSVREFLSRPKKAAPIVRPLEGCPTVALIPGAASAGILETSDCSLRTFFASARIGLRADLYEIRTEGDRVLTVEMTANGFEPDLYILDQEGYELSYDGTSATDGLAKAALHVEAGTYYVLATSLSGLGDYSVQLKSEAPRTCVAPTLELSQDVTGAFDAADCRLIDLAVGETSLTPVDGYLIRVSDKKVLSLAYSSSSNPALLLLIDSNLELVTATDEDGLSVQAVSSVSPGEYALFIAAMDESSGAYTISRPWRTRGRVRTGHSTPAPWRMEVWRRRTAGTWISSFPGMIRRQLTFGLLTSRRDRL